MSTTIVKKKKSLDKNHLIVSDKLGKLLAEMYVYLADRPTLTRLKVKGTLVFDEVRAEIIADTAKALEKFEQNFNKEAFTLDVCSRIDYYLGAVNLKWR